MVAGQGGPACKIITEEKNLGVGEEPGNRSCPYMLLRMFVMVDLLPNRFAPERVLGSL